MQALINCHKALTNLASFLKEAEQSPASKAIEAGVIQSFEYNFELFWKLFQKIAAQEGRVANSPRQAFVTAYQMGLFKDEQVWLDILRDRNLTSHTYHEDMATEVFSHIRDHYYPAFSETLLIVEKYVQKNNPAI